MKIKYLLSSNGIISALNKNLTFNELFSSWEWSTDDIESLDEEYLNNWSGEKEVSLVVNNLIDDGATTVTVLDIITSLIKARYYTKWKKLHDTLTVEYSATSPYMMKVSDINHIEGGETGTNNSTNTRTPNLTESTASSKTANTTGNETNSNNVNTKSTDIGTENGTEITEVSDSTENGIYGYNSSAAVGDTNSSGINNSSITNVNSTSDSSDVTTNGSSSRDNTISSSESGNITKSSTGSETTAISGSDNKNNTEDSTRNITREGNIGNKTMQELLNEERDYWQWQLISVIFNDIDYVLAGGMYADSYR